MYDIAPVYDKDIFNHTEGGFIRKITITDGDLHCPGPHANILCLAKTPRFRYEVWWKSKGAKCVKIGDFKTDSEAQERLVHLIELDA